MNKKTLFSIMLSIVFGIAAILIAQNWLEENKPKAAENELYVSVATMNIPIGTEIQAKHIVLKAIPKSLATDDTVETPDDIYEMIAKDPIYAGDIIRKERLFIKGQGSTLASLISKNMRAITIRVNDVVGVAGFLLPGNRVDILSTSQKDNKVITEIILNNIKILAIDQRAVQNENKPQLVRAVTVEVNLNQAEALLTARSKGRLQLALRNPVDNDNIASMPIAQKTLLPVPINNIENDTSLYTPEPTYKAKTRAHINRDVEIIRGTVQESIQLKN